MKKILPGVFFLLFAPVTLFLSLLTILEIEMAKSFPSAKRKTIELTSSKTPLEIYSSLPRSINSISQEISIGDARPILIRNYLEKYKSPLLPYSDLIFQVSKKYGLDYGLIVAIAQCESNVCKKIPEGSYNCWGFENGKTRFLSWEQAIEQVAKTLKEEYYDKGLVTPREIMLKYAPPSVEKGGPWARCVEQFLEELR